MAKNKAPTEDEILESTQVEDEAVETTAPEAQEGIIESTIDPEITGTESDRVLGDEEQTQDENLESARQEALRNSAAE